MNDNIYKYSKDNAIAFLLLVVISTVVIFTPAFTIQYIGLDLAFSFVFITEILISTSFYIFYLRRIPGCKITIKTNAKTLKLLVISFAVIALMQLLIFAYRDNLNNSESTSLNWIEIFILVLIVPYYEEIVGFAPIFPDTCYHLTHYWPAAADIPVASDNPVHYADAIRYNARTPLQGSLLPLTRLV
ncbi:hypothetical protein FGAF829_46090 (plasmid) [Escherichia coli]|nr:hypothetical protein FGAF829_46090 [Escherichia coli]